MLWSMKMPYRLILKFIVGWDSTFLTFYTKNYRGLFHEKKCQIVLQIQLKKKICSFEWVQVWEWYHRKILHSSVVGTCAKFCGNEMQGFLIKMIETDSPHRNRPLIAEFSHPELVISTGKEIGWFCSLLKWTRWHKFFIWYPYEKKDDFHVDDLEQDCSYVMCISDWVHAGSH